MLNKTSIQSIAQHNWFLNLLPVDKPALDENDLPKVDSGSVNLDKYTKHYIHSYLDYQYVLVNSSAEAFDLERQCRAGIYLGQQPFLNPMWCCGVFFCIQVRKPSNDSAR